MAELFQGIRSRPIWSNWRGWVVSGFGTDGIPIQSAIRAVPDFCKRHGKPQRNLSWPIHRFVRKSSTFYWRFSPERYAAARCDHHRIWRFSGDRFELYKLRMETKNSLPRLSKIFHLFSAPLAAFLKKQLVKLNFHFFIKRCLSSSTFLGHGWK